MDIFLNFLTKDDRWLNQSQGNLKGDLHFTSEPASRRMANKQ